MGENIGEGSSEESWIGTIQLHGPYWKTFGRQVYGWHGVWKKKSGILISSPFQSDRDHGLVSEQPHFNPLHTHKFFQGGSCASVPYPKSHVTMKFRNKEAFVNETDRNKLFQRIP